MPQREITSHTMKSLRSVSTHQIIIFVVLFLPLLIYLHGTPSPVPNAPLPPASLQGAFRDSYLSFHSFHYARVKDELLSILDPHGRNAVVIAGVGPGDDLLRFAKSGRPVYGFEPISEYVTNLRRRIEDTPFNSSVTLYRIGVGALPSSSMLRFEYEGITDYARVDRIDNNYIPKDMPIAALSIDVQGMEWDVIMGGAQTMKEAHSVWVQLGGCSNTTDLVLYRLHEHYELFDFIPWGEPLELNPTNEWHNVLQPFAWKEDAPRRIREFVWWFCWLEKRKYKSLQTDVVGIRRDIWQSDKKLRERVRSIAETACTAKGTESNCKLRTLLRESKRPV